MTAPQRLTTSPSQRVNLHTSTELAQAVARLELSATPTLMLHTYLTAGQVFARVRPHIAPGGKDQRFDRHDLETALDVLAARGLVSLEREEWETTAARPQRYRWSRLATVESLERFTATERRCERQSCGKRIDRDVRFCSKTCANGESKRRARG